jgi:predicted RecB family nuclease
MFLLGDDARLVISASDLRTASACEFALVRALDVLLGRAEEVPAPPDPMADRIIALGNEHEQVELRRLVDAHRGRIVQFERPGYTRDELQEAHSQTVAALSSPDTEVVYQATFFDGGLVGHADFLERTDHGWLVSDTKLARTESVPALLQIAAYAAMLGTADVPTAPVARLVVGSGDVRDFALDDIVPVYLRRRARLDAMLADHRDDGEAAQWGDPRWLACGRCEVCEPEVEAARDLLLVAGMRGPTRRRLRDVGVVMIEQLAVRTEPVPEVRSRTLTRLREQARLQLEQEHDPEGGVRSEVVETEPLRLMPAPSPGDVFFDFEGDPLWSERGSSVWGLEYLFGVVTVDTGAPAFHAFWAHDRVEERQALIDFVNWLGERRRQWPDLRVYHYAPYETAALLRLAARHGVCEDEVDQLLREGVFVDLFAVVRSSIRVSQRSYSIKKLEPLYMGAREAAVTNAADSIVVYHQFIAATVAGRIDEAAGLLREIADYNRDDCEST